MKVQGCRWARRYRPWAARQLVALALAAASLSIAAAVASGGGGGAALNWWDPCSALAGAGADPDWMTAAAMQSYQYYYRSPHVGETQLWAYLLTQRNCINRWLASRSSVQSKTSSSIVLTMDTDYRGYSYVSRTEVDMMATAGYVTVDLGKKGAGLAAAALGTDPDNAGMAVGKLVCGLVPPNTDNTSSTDFPGVGCDVVGRGIKLREIGSIDERSIRDYKYNQLIDCHDACKEIHPVSEEYGASYPSVKVPASTMGLLLDPKAEFELVPVVGNSTVVFNNYNGFNGSDVKMQLNLLVGFDTLATTDASALVMETLASQMIGTTPLYCVKWNGLSVLIGDPLVAFDTGKFDACDGKGVEEAGIVLFGCVGCSTVDAGLIIVMPESFGGGVSKGGTSSAGSCALFIQSQIGTDTASDPFLLYNTSNALNTDALRRAVLSCDATQQILLSADNSLVVAFSGFVASDQRNAPPLAFAGMYEMLGSQSAQSALARGVVSYDVQISETVGKRPVLMHEDGAGELVRVKKLQGNTSDSYEGRFGEALAAALQLGAASITGNGHEAALDPAYAQLHQSVAGIGWLSLLNGVVTAVVASLSAFLASRSFEFLNRGTLASRGLRACGIVLEFLVADITNIAAVVDICRNREHCTAIGWQDKKLQVPTAATSVDVYASTSSRMCAKMPFFWLKLAIVALGMCAVLGVILVRWRVYRPRKAAGGLKSNGGVVRATAGMVVGESCTMSQRYTAP